MQSFHCPHCLPAIIVPQLTKGSTDKIVALIRGNHFLTAVNEFKKLGLDISSAKGTAMHVTLDRGKCNRCKNDKLDNGVVTCENCKALNINW